MPVGYNFSTQSVTFAAETSGHGAVKMARAQWARQHPAPTWEQRTHDLIRQVKKILGPRQVKKILGPMYQATTRTIGSAVY